MPLADKKLNTIARLAMGTAMISVLAGCDGRFGRAYDAVFAPITGADQTVTTVPATAPAYGNAYVTPGVPTYTEQTQSANLQTFESIYGQPVSGSATQSYATQQPYSVPSFDDGSVDVTPIDAPQIATYTQRVEQAQQVYSAAPAPVTLDTGTLTYIDPMPTQAASSSYAVATVPSTVVPTSTLPMIGEPVSTGEAVLGLDTTAVGGLVETAPATFGAGPVIDTFETTTILDSGFDALPVEQTYQDAMAPAMPAPAFAAPLDQLSYDTSFSSGGVEIISNEEAVATFEGETLPPPLPPIGGSVFDAPDPAPATGGQFQILPQTKLETSDPVTDEPGTIVQMWNSLTTQTASATAVMAPVEVDADLRSVIETSPLPKPKVVTPVPVKVAAVDYSPRTAPTPRQRPARAQASYRTLAKAPLPQPRPAYNKPMAVATTSGKYISIGALPEIGSPALAAPKMPVDTMLPSDAMHGNAMASRDAAPTVDVAMATPPKPSAPKPKVTPAAVDTSSELSGTSWRLLEVYATPIGSNAELHFDGRSGFAGGQGPCNSYGGEFRNTGKGNFSMSDIFSTDVACPGIAAEKQYIAALEKATKYKISDGFSDLTLLDENGEAVATFRAF
jgi:heat shock protein HslJ